MIAPTPLHVKQTTSSELLLLWSDGHRSLFTTRTLRDGCPCAGCKGETVPFESYRPPDVDILVPGRYELKGIEQVGGYALKFVWADGHDTGLYTWEHLHSICECVECRSKREQNEQ